MMHSLAALLLMLHPLAVGQSMKVPTTAMRSWSVDHPAICAVGVANGDLVITGKAAGTCSVIGVYADGSRVTWNIAVN